jgi:hypothetical protein
MDISIVRWDDVSDDHDLSWDANLLWAGIDTRRYVILNEPYDGFPVGTSIMVYPYNWHCGIPRYLDVLVGGGHVPRRWFAPGPMVCVGEITSFDNAKHEEATT